VASAEKPPYLDNSFDLIIAINSIHNLPLEACKTVLVVGIWDQKQSGGALGVLFFSIATN
jgi:hypothetical protein